MNNELVPSTLKGNAAVYKDLILVTVTIKRYFSREHSGRECAYRSVALASIRSFAVVRVCAIRYFRTSTGSAF